jgi:hypothetical protein
MKIEKLGLPIIAFCNLTCYMLDTASPFGVLNLFVSGFITGIWIITQEIPEKSLTK